MAPLPLRLQVPFNLCHKPGSEFLRAGAERRAVLDAMRGFVEKDLQQPVVFVVRTMRVCGTWGFVVAKPVEPGGAALKWQTTICKSDVSHLVGALVQKDKDGAWQSKDYALCPTDVAWESWPEKYGAPQALFGK